MQNQDNPCKTPVDKIKFGWPILRWYSPQRFKNDTSLYFHQIFIPVESIQTLERSFKQIENQMYHFLFLRAVSTWMTFMKVPTSNITNWGLSWQNFGFINRIMTLDGVVFWTSFVSEYNFVLQLRKMSSPVHWNSLYIIINSGWMHQQYLYKNMQLISSVRSKRGWDLH